MNPVTKQLPQPVTVVSINATPVQTVHQKDGQGYGSQGEKGGLIDVKKGKPIYDEKGQQAADFHEKKRRLQGLSRHRPQRGRHQAADCAQ